jgi:hypothetical protein
MKAEPIRARPLPTLGVVADQLSAGHHLGIDHLRSERPDETSKWHVRDSGEWREENARADGKTAQRQVIGTRRKATVECREIIQRAH